MLNNVTLMGRLTKDPELRSTTNSSLTAFTVAVERDYQSGSERQVDFVECVAWRKTAEHICKYFHKGQMIALTGSLQSRKWEDKNGNQRTSWEVIVNSVYFCGDKKTASPNVEFEEVEDEGELPF